ncbi:MAG: ABC transporter substrate-binding protein [Alphaproteobacteria bacterium]
MKQFLLPTAVAAALAAGAPALAQDHVTFGTNWVAQAEHGGYYQALATGIYEAFGLDVEIRPGGPQINHRQMLVAGNIDFLMGGNNSESYNFVVEGLPFLSVATIFQKDPQVWIAHESQGWQTIEDLKNATQILISADARTSYYPFMVKLYGFGRRHHHRARTACRPQGRRRDRRQGLRQQGIARPDRRRRSPGRHPIQSLQDAANPPRRSRLQAAQPYRAILQQAQTLPSPRHPIRSPRNLLPRRSPHRKLHDLDAMIVDSS